MTLRSAIRAAAFVLVATSGAVAWAHADDAFITPQNWPSQ